MASSPHQVTVDLQVDGLAQPPQQVSVEAGQSADVQWNDLPASAQQLEVRIEQPDALALDNAAWVVLGGQQATRVLLVTDGNTFLERALELRPGVSVVRGSPADYAEPAGSARYDLVVFDGFIPPTLPASGSLLLVDPPASSSLANVGDELPVPSIRASGAGSPLLANVALDTIHINRTRELDLPAWADAIVETPDTPLLIAGERQGQRVAVLGFDLHQSDLPLQPAFPVLVQNLLDWLVPGGGVASPTIRAGQSEGLRGHTRRAVDRRRRTRWASNVDRPALSATVVRPDRSARSLYRGAAGHQRRAGLVDLRGELLRAEPIPPGRGRCNRGERFGAERGVRPAGAARGVGRRRRCHARVADAGVVGGLPLLSTMVPFQVGQPLVLLLLLPLVAFVGLVWQRSTHPPRSIRTRLLLGSRLVAGAALVLALAEISFHGSVSRQAVVFVADVSSSTDAARQSEQDFITRAIAAKQPDDGFAVVTTAQQALVDHVFGTLPDFDTFHTSVPSDGTDLAAGLRLAGAVLPSAYRTRLVLLSDGHETTGDAAEQARLLQARGVETDVVPLSIPTGPEVLLEQVAAPSTVQADERFTVDVGAESTVQTPATVQVYLDDQLVDTQSVTLQPGITQVSSQAQTSAVGLHELRATIAPEIDTLPQNNEATAIVDVQGAPRVLVIEQRPGEGANIAAALTGAGMQVETRAPAGLPTSTEQLGSYNTVVLADVSADSLNDQQMELLRSYVHDLGRGLVAIGGESSYGQGDYAGTPLDDVLPVSSTVRGHRDQGRVAMMLVIDHSGSMADDPKHEGTAKIVMARQAATLAVDQLAPDDEVGILRLRLEQPLDRTDDARRRRWHLRHRRADRYAQCRWRDKYPTRGERGAQRARAGERRGIPAHDPDDGRYVVLRWRLHPAAGPDESGQCDAVHHRRWCRRRPGPADPAGEARRRTLLLRRSRRRYPALHDARDETGHARSAGGRKPGARPGHRRSGGRTCVPIGNAGADRLSGNNAQGPGGGAVEIAGRRPGARALAVRAGTSGGIHQRPSRPLVGGLAELAGRTTAAGGRHGLDNSPGAGWSARRPPQ